MKGEVFLVHWNESQAEEYAEELRSDGWKVEVQTEDGGRAFKFTRGNPPDVVVVHLSDKPSHGREVAHTLRQAKATRHLPIVFVDGEEEAVQKTKAKVPDAVFTTSAELRKVLGTFSKSGDPEWGPRADK